MFFLVKAPRYLNYLERYGNGNTFPRIYTHKKLPCRLGL